MSSSGSHQEEAGFTRAYSEAAKKGTAIIDDAKAGIKVDHVKIAAAALAVDPTKPFRERVALNLATKLKDSKSKKCLDVGCSIGGDLILLRNAMQGQTGFEAVGVDILEAQLVKARESLPEGKFVEGNVTTLPFKDEEMDSVQCSRLLIHVPDMSKALDEMLRVLRPEGCGVFAEGNFHGHVIFTSDMRLKAIDSAQHVHTTSMCANPGAAMDVYKLLLARSDVENVKIAPYNMLLTDPSFGMGLAYFKPMLEALVAKKAITQEDMDYYFETLPKAQQTGDFFISDSMFEVSFDKKNI